MTSVERDAKQYIEIAQEKGTRAFSLDARLARKRIIDDMKAIVAQRYWMIDSLLSNPILLPSGFPEWMRKDDNEAIMLHPGDPIRPGLAATDKGELRKVKSICGYEPKDPRVKPDEFHRAFFEIIEYWQHQRPSRKIRTNVKKP